MFESQELVPANLLFELIANKMQLLFDLLHVFFKDRDLFLQFTDRLKGRDRSCERPPDPRRIL